MRMKVLHKFLVDTRMAFSEELGLMYKVEPQTTKVLIEANQLEFQSQLEDVVDRAGQERGKGNGAGAAKPPDFDGSTTRPMLRRRFETGAEHICWTRQKSPHT